MSFHYLGALLTISSIILALSLFRLIQVYRILKQVETSEGEIVSIDEVWDEEYQTYNKIPTWRYITSQGEITSKKIIIGLSEFNMIIGEKRNVFYRKNNPKEAMLDYRPYKFLVIPILFASVSTVAIILTIIGLNRQ